jgi:hypothetical protein
MDENEKGSSDILYYFKIVLGYSSMTFAAIIVTIISNTTEFPQIGFTHIKGTRQHIFLLFVILDIRHSVSI